MASSPATSRITVPRPPSLTGKSRFDRRLSSILAHATNVFYEKGYEGASMRDLSRASGMWLAGMFHYFESKENLLNLFQRKTLTKLLKKCSRSLDLAINPKEKTRRRLHASIEFLNCRFLAALGMTRI